MNWHIGQRIVAVRSHSQGKFKKGDEFTIDGIIKSPCKCGGVLLDVGMSSAFIVLHCPDCLVDWKSNNINWFHESLFAPLDDLSNHTADSLMEEMDKKILITI